MRVQVSTTSSDDTPPKAQVVQRQRTREALSPFTGTTPLAVVRLASTGATTHKERERERERRDATRARARVASSMIDIDRAIRRMGILCRQAEHLTEIDSALFAGVHASELLGCRWQKLPCSSLSQISAVCAACVRAAA